MNYSFIKFTHHIPLHFAKSCIPGGSPSLKNLGQYPQFLLSIPLALDVPEGILILNVVEGLSAQSKMVNGVRFDIRTKAKRY